MSKIVTKACVIGSGVMGANIAALLAGVGMQVTLLDIVPFKGLDDKEKAKGLTEESPEFRNRLTNAAMKKLKTDKQMPLYSKSALQNICTGNTTDDLNLIRDADWVIEVVVERIDVKKGLLKQIEPYVKPDAIVSSNTSGVSITKIVEDMPEDFKTRFMGTHFFNPPRWMGLFEMIPTQWTSRETIETMAHVGGDLLGKTCVYAKDTPNFVGNRIGCFGAAQIMKLTERYDYDFATVDYLTGKVMGHPKSATFGTGDMVGMDIIANVSKNVIDASKDAKEIEDYTMPAYVAELMEKGYLGDKAKRGFYRKERVDGKKVKYQWNYKTHDYELVEGKPKLSTVEAALASGNKYAAMLWSNTGIMDWMEKTYGAITVMDGFGYQDGIIMDDLNDWEKIKRQTAEMMLRAPMIHGATGPTEYWLKVIDKMYEDYGVNVSIFMGHVGCKHTWASGKIVTDYIQEKFGIPTLYVDVDAIDPRYKSNDELRAQISEYMESVVGAENFRKDK